MRPASPDIPQPGQPYAAPRVKMQTHGESGRRMAAFVYPYQVVNVKRRSDLELALDHFCHVPTMPNSNAVKTPEGMRYTLEWIYPALRWFCRAYNEPIPTWLQGNGWAEGMPKDEAAKMFGPKPLQVQEWHEDPRHAGKRA